MSQRRLQAALVAHGEPRDGTLPGAATAGLAGRPFGIYVHVPFCQTRCGYCDFNTYTAEELGPGVSRATWLDSTRSEVALARRVLPGAPPLSTVFVGGGTPTLLLPEDPPLLLPPPLDDPLLPPDELPDEPDEPDEPPLDPDEPPLDPDDPPLLPPEHRTPVDRWLLSHLAEAVGLSTAAFEEHDYMQAHQAASRMFWPVFCDRYLEMVKDRLAGAAIPAAASSKGPWPAMQRTAPSARQASGSAAPASAAGAALSEAAA